MYISVWCVLCQRLTRLTAKEMCQRFDGVLKRQSPLLCSEYFNFSFTHLHIPILTFYLSLQLRGRHKQFLLLRVTIEWAIEYAIRIQQILHREERISAYLWNIFIACECDECEALALWARTNHFHIFEWNRQSVSKSSFKCSYLSIVVLEDSQWRRAYLRIFLRHSDVSSCINVFNNKIHCTAHVGPFLEVRTTRTIDYTYVVQGFIIRI